MAKMRLSPYLNFDGNCAEAMQFYHNVLSGTLDIQKFGETPMEASVDMKDKIVHALMENEFFTIMASDTISGQLTVSGSSVHLSLDGTDGEKLKEIFEKLSEGGSVDMPLAKQFWGDEFGMLTDRYHIHWMVNINRPKEEEKVK